MSTSASRLQMERHPIPEVISQHAESTASLHVQRCVLVDAPHAKLPHLGRADQRLAAHLDGLAVAGETGLQVCEHALEHATPGGMFAAITVALEQGRHERVVQLLALGEALPVEIQRGAIAAFGWVCSEHLRGIVRELLVSGNAFQRLVGLAACGMHRVSPGLTSVDAAVAITPAMRARALRLAGELGRRDALGECLAALSDADPNCRFWAAATAVMLGDRRSALEALVDVASSAGPYQARAARLAFAALPHSDVQQVLKAWAAHPERIRAVIRAMGIAGDASYAPWLIQQMHRDALARIAGESFSLITGADLAALDLERQPPESFESGPNDDPDDPNVALDEDDGLPWPEQQRIERWWAQNGSRFVPGHRYLLGASVTRAHCIDVLKTGYQRQRILAAHYLCILEPGSVLFEWRAPAWRQAQALAALG